MYDVSYMNLTDHLDETLQYYAIATFGLTTCTYFILFSISHLKFFIHRKLNAKEADYSEPIKIWLKHFSILFIKWHFRFEVFYLELK